MTSVSLLDYIMSDASAGAEEGSIRGLAAKLVEMAVAEIHHIREMDEQWAANRPEEDFDPDLAALMRSVYEQWHQRTAEVLKRIDQLEQNGARITGSEQLRHEYYRVSAMLQVTPDDIERAEADIAAGRVHPISELRNELRARLQQRGT